MKLKDFFKKLVNKKDIKQDADNNKDIKQDANNNWAIKFNSKKLLLLKEDDGSLKIAIVACEQTKNMIKEFCNGEVDDSKFNKVAYTLSGEVVKLEQRVETNFRGKDPYYLYYYYKNLEVAPLFDHSEQSDRWLWKDDNYKATCGMKTEELIDYIKRTPHSSWLIDKYKALGEIKAEDRLTDVDLLLLQGKLNKEQQLVKQAQQEVERNAKNITSKSTKQQDSELEM